MKQVLRIHDNEYREPEPVRASIQLLKQVIADATDLKDRDQARKLRDALWSAMRAIEDGRQEKEIVYYETRVDPGGYVPELRGASEGI
ncbi:hypothetical protein GJ744_011767 [Endocarpon pusillum]|uniref:Uncharacterized protein n=1 Tax=Endocarpon pusillum TaxID=364733 RepID=A0A8H7E357_9EURO|nr:hypothetical protein GJ744_011767 [Endocarpon pusillum]